MQPDYFLKHLLLYFLPFFSIGLLSAQNQHHNRSQEPHYRIMFYNLENLFDTYDDPYTNDDEFTPKGAKSWSGYRYEKKLNDLAKVIIAVGEWTPPSIIGLCEVENFQVLLDLATKTPLAGLDYQIVHENSSDERGIDVALLYRPKDVQRISHSKIVIKSGSDWKTRDILLAQMRVNEADTLFIYVNHWPSRFGGKETTEPKRLFAAQTLRQSIDSLQRTRENPKILIMGDFNDEPRDKSISEVLETLQIEENVAENRLYNLSYSDLMDNKGTIVYREINNTWFLFDQIILSGTLINGKGIVAKGQKSMIFDAPWILKDNKPFRTYQGPIYFGGYSDHLPIFIDLYLKQ
jgi:exonuclease III